MVRVAVAGASGYMGAELLRLLSVHPKITLTGVTSDRLARRAPEQDVSGICAASASTDSTTSTPNGSPRSPTSSSWRCPTWSRRRWSRFCGDTAAGRSTCRLTIVCETRTTTSRGTRRRTSTCPGSARRCTGCRSFTERPSRRPPWSPPRLLPGRRDPGDGAALQDRARTARGDRHRRQVGGDVSRRAGVKIDPMYLYTEANENVQAYGIAGHRHTPEIEQELGALAGAPLRVALHAPPRPAEPRTLHDGIGAARLGGLDRAAARRLSRVLRGRAVRARARRGRAPDDAVGRGLELLRRDRRRRRAHQPRRVRVGHRQPRQGRLPRTACTT